MVTWQDVCSWDHEALMYAVQDLKFLRTSLTGIGRNADLALSRVVSQAPSVEAARSTLRRCNAAHHELLTQVDSLVRATSQAHDDVAEVRRRVLACQDYAAARPFLNPSLRRHRLHPSRRQQRFGIPGGRRVDGRKRRIHGQRRVRGRRRPPTGAGGRTCLHGLGDTDPGRPSRPGLRHHPDRLE